MIRRAISALALTAVLAAPAVAQTPFNANFTFSSGGTFDTYSGALTGGGYTGNVFQVFCVNPKLFVSEGQTYTNAWVTPMSASVANSGNTITPNSIAWNTAYMNAARIASFGLGGVGGNPNAVNLQFAIWQAMGWTFNAGNIGTYSSSIQNAFNGANYNAASVAAYTAQGLALAGTAFDISANQWLVVTDARKGNQEFIFNDPDRPQETVPEPATMTLLATGLVGMAAAKRRRNKKS